MGKLKKKKRNIHKKGRRRGKKSSSSFPLDLTSEILSRLPAKSVVRLSCVSKLWSSITTEPYFINSFETQSLTKPSLILFFKKSDKLFVFSFPQHNSDSYSQYSYQMKYPKYCAFSPTESVHGLICFRKKANPTIWNPTMRQFTTLPKPEKSWKRITVFLGYDPIGGKHKVVCMPFNKTCDECRVLTLGSAQESWRIVKTNRTHRPFTDSCGRCINGVLYYKAFLGHSNVTILMSFDVRSEKFDMIVLPPGDSKCMLIPYKGRLGRLVNGKLYVLEDATKHIWSCKHIAPLVYYDQSLETKFKLSGITHAGESIYVPYKFHTSFYILYYDPKRGSIRKVEFKGIADDQFRRTNGLGDIFLSPLLSFPNHTENLISL